MKRCPAAIFLILFVATVSRAQDKAQMEANAILLEAPRFRLEAQFSFLREGKEIAKGAYSREFESAALWHEELEFGQFKYRKVRIKRQIWTKQNADFIPPAAEGLLGAFNLTTSHLVDTEVVKRIKDRKIEGVEARCIEYENIVGKDKEQGQICVQSDTGYVIYRQYGERATTYSQFSSLGSKVRPHHFTIDFVGSDKLVADVNYREVEKFDPSGFEPIVDGEVQNVCTTSRPAVPKFTPGAVNSFDVKRGVYKGNVTVDLKIGPDGHVVNAAVEETLLPDLDATEVAAAKTLLFEPATCDGIPVASYTKQVWTYH
jgi:hypothetical protein